jgi:putative ABC transport system permease protein
MISVREHWRIATGALRANWFRAVLTALGIVIGVGSLIAVTAVSAGAREEVADSIRRLGSNVVIVDGEQVTTGTRQSATERTITPADVAAISELDMVEAVAPLQDMEGVVVSAGENQATTFLFGVTGSYSDVLNQRVVEGRLVSDADVSFGRKVMLIGLRVRDRLFPEGDALGQFVRVGNQEFEVVGIQSNRGSLAGEDLDNRVFVPLPIVTGFLLGGGPGVKSVNVRVSSEDEIEPAQDAITELLLANHKIPDGYPEDFSTEDQATILKEAERATGTFRALTFALGGIALLVGGIGIMNMMLVSVHERMREIGIRKSVGAGPGTIQAQFLIEALVLSVIGGLIGVFGGIVATKMISSFAGWQTLINAGTLPIAFSVALAVGLFFGFYPARVAARLDPVAALRYE